MIDTKSSMLKRRGAQWVGIENKLNMYKYSMEIIIQFISLLVGGQSTNVFSARPVQVRCVEIVHF